MEKLRCGTLNDEVKHVSKSRIMGFRNVISVPWFVCSVLELESMEILSHMILFSLEGQVHHGRKYLLPPALMIYFF